MPQPSSASAVPASVTAEAGIRGAAPARRYPIDFTATAGQYFRIWIVNLALTIITLGIYSAWAKVRKRRYFYSHTRIDGEGFEYRANPIAILKGRLIAVGLFAIFYAATHYAPVMILPFYLVLLVVGPWLVVRSLAFNAYNTAWRNVRLRFSGTYWTCMKLVLGYGLLTVVTLGLAFPFLKRRLVQFAVDEHSYGATGFTLSEDFKKRFLRPYIVVYAVGVGLFALGFIAALVMPSIAGRAQAGPGISAGMVNLMIAGIFLFYAGLFVLVAYLKARTNNAVWDGLAIGPARFECAIRARDLIWLYFSNFVVVLLTIGLATPWAVVRMARYRASRMGVVASGPLDAYAQAEAKQVSATGEEVGEMFAIDIAL
jgi:uncharacterized membrane protein YjgN (DUF898 family)